MKIRIPRGAVTLWDAFVEWGDVPVYTFGRHTLRRIDVVTAFCGVACVAYYGALEGWIGALKGALAFAFVAMTALWILRPH